MLGDLRELSEDEIQPLRVECQILAGDGRTLQIPELGGKAFDLIIYSPPYLNNIDYSEVYKLELWLSAMSLVKKNSKPCVWARFVHIRA